MLEISKKIKTLRYGEPGHVKRARACKASQSTQNKPHKHKGSCQTHVMQCLRLNNTSINGKAPQGKQQQIKRCSDIVQINTADIEFGEHSAGISCSNDRKNKDHGKQLFGVPFHRINLPLSLSQAKEG